ncbi:sialate O-acetylesterase [Flexithrix dorotheae]|uniref:sialate O-acetylesterase n=1 Tax=Flexithrix dorotheae TaxID=70993 RepID=UPI0003A1DA1E|nr:sialate O-acetylesterase [Flexithrix dorotheae]
MMIKNIFFAGLLLIIQLSANAQLKVSGMFSDNMILQREQKIPVWGWANAGNLVEVKLKGESFPTITNNEGKRMVWLPPQPATEQPLKLEIKSDGQSIEFSNVLIGEVWFASGQSNMNFQVKKADNAEVEIANANFPAIRIYTVPNVVSKTPKADVDGKWLECHANTIPEFSAVAYFFGREIHKLENVPVGIIKSAWGGTPSEPWTSLEIMGNHPDFKEEIESIKHSQDDFMQKYLEQDMHYKSLKEIIAKVLEEDKNTYATLKYNDADWLEMVVPIHFHNTEIKGFHGIAWMRKHFHLTKEQAQKDIALTLGKIEQTDKTYVNGKPIGEGNYTHKQRDYLIPAALLKEGDNVIAIRIKHMRIGGGGIYARPLQMVQDKKVILNLEGKWKYNPSLEHESKPFSTVYQYLPGALFNGMVAPVIPYGIKGVIWYQGESNVSRAYQYREIFPLLINDWRIHWKQGNFPFLFVQLANHKSQPIAPVSDKTAELREAQSKALSLPNTGMAVAIDIGDANDIHPKNKQEVGKRLALAAEKIAYHKDIVFAGPTFKHYQIKEGKIAIKFDNVGAGLTTNGDAELKGFAIAGDDGKFVWAKASIIDKNTVEVFNENIENPKMVRYAWASNPVCNLYNEEGLPAVPFRTDDLRGVTYGRK